MRTGYIDWLERQGVRLVQKGGVFWQRYQGALIPADAVPRYVALSPNDSKELLRESGALFVRYESAPVSGCEEWWYLLCDTYDYQSLSPKTRETLRRGKRNCEVRLIDAELLAGSGYQCYAAALKRYRNARVLSMKQFRSNILSTTDGPFEYWGIFVQGELAGYSQCIIDDHGVCFSLAKYHPDYLRHQISYAHIDAMLYHYVTTQGRTVYSGMRSIAHDTQYQALLVKLGHRKHYCKLNIVYRPALRYIVQAIYPLRGLMAKMPEKALLGKVKTMLALERIRRACNAG